MVFLTWAEVELKMNGSSAAISVLQNVKIASKVIQAAVLLILLEIHR